MLLDGADVTGVPPYERNVNTVFQDYALFPHMSVVENVAYGLRVRGVAARERRKRAEEMLALVQLEGLGERSAVAAVGRPEAARRTGARAHQSAPLYCCSMSRSVRSTSSCARRCRSSSRTCSASSGSRSCIVTHDQGEALSMADRVAVFDRGRIEQLDTPRGLYTRPRTAFVARFVGGANVVDRRPCAAPERRGACFCDSRRIDGPRGRGMPRADAVRVALRRVIDVQYHGASSRWQVRTDDGSILAVVRPESGSSPVNYTIGSKVLVSWPASQMVRAGRHVIANSQGIRDGGAGMTSAAIAAGTTRGSLRREVSSFFYRRSTFYLLLLLLPPLLWLGTVYLGSLFALLLQSFYAIDEFTAHRRAEGHARDVPAAGHAAGQRRHHPAHAVHGGRGHDRERASIAFPIANYMARYAGPRMKAFFYVGVMLPMWTSYLVKVYAWRLILAKQGILSWMLDHGRPRRACSRLRSQRRSSAARRSPPRTSACSSCSSTCGCRS